MPAAQRTFAPTGQAATAVAAWPAADLVDRLERALHFAATVVADFGTTGYTDPVRPALGFGPEKVVAEAAMLGYAAARVDDPRITRRVTALVDDLDPLVRSRTALADLVRHPARAFKRAVPHVLLTALGRPDEAFDTVARRACSRVLGHAADEAAAVLAERQWIADLWGLPEGDGIPRHDPTATTALHRPVDLLVDGREDPYGLTHLLFYVTDFGRHRPRLGRPRDALLADVEAQLVRFLDRDDFDLAAELLMAWPLLQAPWSPTAAFALRVLAQAEDEVGVLPCGNVDPQRLGALTGPERTRYARATSYHTALVMGFLCAACLTSPTPPPVTIGGPGAGSDAWADYWGVVRDGTARWQVTFEAVDDAERPALASLLCAVALDRALSRNDIPAIGAALTTAHRHHLPPTPWLTAAADLLDALTAAVTASE